MSKTQAPEGAQLPPLPKAVAFVDSTETTSERGWLNAMAWAWDEMQIPLFTAEQMHAYARAALAASAPQAPVALTDAQVDRLYANVPPSAQQDARSREAFRRLVRVVEAAHGIKEQQ